MHSITAARSRGFINQAQRLQPVQDQISHHKNLAEMYCATCDKNITATASKAKRNAVPQARQYICYTIKCDVTHKYLEIGFLTLWYHKYSNRRVVFVYYTSGEGRILSSLCFTLFARQRRYTSKVINRFRISTGFSQSPLGSIWFR